jgi:NAD(P)-dependent dehydrogenase (short-subunit alcohol dehydrogenase family)
MKAEATNPTVLLIGTSRGLGYALAAEYLERGSRVVATVRGTARTALHDLQEIAGGLEIEQADINAPEQIQALRDRLSARRFDLLFVNAGVTNGAQETTADVSTAGFTRLMVTNALSPIRVIETATAASPTTSVVALRSTEPASPRSTS